MLSGEKARSADSNSLCAITGLEQRWYDYLAEAYRDLAIRWCAEEGLEYME